MRCHHVQLMSLEGGIKSKKEKERKKKDLGSKWDGIKECVSHLHYKRHVLYKELCSNLLLLLLLLLLLEFSAAILLLIS